MDIRTFIFRTFLSGILLLPTLANSAMLVEAEIGVGAWFYDTVGNFNHQGTYADVDADLLLDDDTGSVSYITIEHPLPSIPNIRLKKLNLSASGNGTVTGTGFTFGGVNYTSGDSITTELILDHTDVTLYYKILDNVIDVDLGVTVMMLNGSAEVTRGGVSNRKMIDTTIPLVHYKLGISFLPTAFRFQFDGNHMDMSDGYFCSLDTKIIYQPDAFYGVEVGYRDEKFKFDGKQGLYSDVDFEGPFVNLYVHF